MTRARARDRNEPAAIGLHTPTIGRNHLTSGRTGVAGSRQGHPCGSLSLQHCGSLFRGHALRFQNGRPSAGTQPQRTQARDQPSIETELRQIESHPERQLEATNQSKSLREFSVLALPLEPQWDALLGCYAARRCFSMI